MCAASCCLSRVRKRSMPATGDAVNQTITLQCLTVPKHESSTPKVLLLRFCYWRCGVETVMHFIGTIIFDIQM